MFGYVKTAEEELKVREQRLYKNYYCGLCREIACYSQSSRLMLSYDMTFLALLMDAEFPGDIKMCRGRIIRRCKKHSSGSKMRYIAAVSIMLQYRKLENDYIDGERKKKYLMYIIKKGYLKASSDYPGADEIIKDAMKKLYQLEQECCKDFPVLEKPFAEMFYRIISAAPFADEYLKVKAELIYHVAAWVYWFDMLQDLEEDKKENHFNAIYMQDNEEKAKETVRKMLMMHTEKAFSLSEILPFSSNLPIIQNIILLGMPGQMGEVHS